MHEDYIIDQVAAIQAASGFHLTTGDISAMRRLLRGEVTVEQEKVAVLAELATARVGAPTPGPPIRDNLLGLTCPAELHIAERRLTSLRMAQLVADPGVLDS
ncbi:hypothetical protein [Gordonia alkaliphila]|uniref:DUF222 domain-containing protein n=1 Tax=Gordonia alkaliphila TaxID=1053547 RepID=A0ABP8Z4J2_9ACTN